MKEVSPKDALVVGVRRGMIRNSSNLLLRCPLSTLHAALRDRCLCVRRD